MGGLSLTANMQRVNGTIAIFKIWPGARPTCCMYNLRLGLRLGRRLDLRLGLLLGLRLGLRLGLQLRPVTKSTFGKRHLEQGKDQRQGESKDKCK